MFLMFGVVAHVDGADHALTTEAMINRHVDDWIMLEELEEAAKEVNFSFLINRKIRTPPKTSQIIYESPEYIDPLFYTLISSKHATMTELKTTLTLEDAFNLLDSVTTTRINEARAFNAAKFNRGR
jgi:hypothetical protein